MVKQAISQINVVLRMHIVTLMARKSTLLQYASPHLGGSLLRHKLKMNRVHGDQETIEKESSSEEYTVHNVGRFSNNLVYVQMLINGKRLSIEVDTGAEVSIISEKTREEIYPEEKLRSSGLN